MKHSSEKRKTYREPGRKRARRSRRASSTYYPESSTLDPSKGLSWADLEGPMLRECSAVGAKNAPSRTTARCTTRGIGAIRNSLVTSLGSTRPHLHKLVLHPTSVPTHRG